MWGASITLGDYRQCLFEDNTILFLEITFPRILCLRLDYKIERKKIMKWGRSSYSRKQFLLSWKYKIFAFHGENEKQNESDKVLYPQESI